jgi:hypothetical protein
VIAGGVERVDPAGQVGDGESICGGRQREYRGHRGAHARAVEVDAGGASGSDVGGLREAVEQAVGNEPDVDPMSTQSNALVNRSSISVRRATMSGNLVSSRPHPSCRVLWVMASNRSTCSPLV